MIRHVLAGVLSTALFIGCGQPQESQSNYDVLDTRGPFLTTAQAKQHIRNAGFSGNMVNTMCRIAKCESSLGVTSFAWGQGRRHTGLFQISDLHHRACGYGSKSLAQFRQIMTNPAANSKCAYVVYKNAGYSIRPWDCRRSLSRFSC